MNPNSITEDTLFDGTLICCQNREGYRFSVDSVLLAHFVSPDSGDTILDIGTGCGVISLILAYRWRNIIDLVCGLEIQTSLASLTEKNFARNNFGDVCRIVSGDVKTPLVYFQPESFSKVVCNPPFFKPGTGRKSKNSEALIARHQIEASLDDFISASAIVLKNRGYAYFIYPANGLIELLALCEKKHLEPKKIQMVYSYPDPEKNAELVLIKCLKNGGKDVEVMPPFYIYGEKNGDYSAPMLALYKG